MGLAPGTWIRSWTWHFGAKIKNRLILMATSSSRATPLSASSSRSFYGSSSSTPGSSKGPKPNRQRLSGLNLVKSLLVANGQNDDVGIDLSDDESINNGGGGASPQYGPTDPESSKEDPDVGQLELSYNSSMYSFEDPVSLTDQSSSQSISRSTPATKSRIGAKKGGSGSATVTPQSRLANGQSEAVGSYCLADMLDRQNNLILELLSKHEQLSTSLQEVRSELRETKETVGKMVQENKATSSKDDVREKMKRKYPSSLTVSIL